MNFIRKKVNEELIILSCIAISATVSFIVAKYIARNGFDETTDYVDFATKELMKTFKELTDTHFNK